MCTRTSYPSSNNRLRLWGDCAELTERFVSRPMPKGVLSMCRKYANLRSRVTFFKCQAFRQVLAHCSSTFSWPFFFIRMSKAPIIAPGQLNQALLVHLAVFASTASGKVPSHCMAATIFFHALFMTCTLLVDVA